jgi:ketosteroid isomerase-like protein
MAGNVEIVRKLTEEWNAGNRERMLDWLHPEAEIRTIRAQLEGRTYQGPAGFRELLADFEEDWEYVRLEQPRFHEKGSFVVALARLQSRGRASGIELDVPVGQLWEFRDDKIVRFETFTEPSEALREAGIES